MRRVILIACIAFAFAIVLLSPKSKWRLKLLDRAPATARFIEIVKHVDLDTPEKVREVALTFMSSVREGDSVSDCAGALAAFPEPWVRDGYSVYHMSFPVKPIPNHPDGTSYGLSVHIRNDTQTVIAIYCGYSCD